MNREQIETDIVCVGAGVAALATVLRLLRRAQEAGVAAPRVMVLEKGRYVGAHVLSGAVLDPAPLAALLTLEERARMPVLCHVVKERFYRLTSRHAVPIPFVPPAMRAKGMPLISLSSFTKFLGDLCEDAGAEIYTEMTAVELLEEHGRIVGVRVGDKGVDKDGTPKASFEPGPEVRAKAVVLGEGACGVLTERLIATRGLAASAEPQAYAIGIKEIIETTPRPERQGVIMHTFGYPLDWRTYGGGFVYGISPSQIALGLVVGLDYRTAHLNPHDLFRAFKRQPLIARHIAGGRTVAYGAKVLPEGGLHAMPELAADGALIVGDGAGMLDSVRLKGIHLALCAGIAAGDTLCECVQRGDCSRDMLAGYARRFYASDAGRQLRRVRNVRTWFSLGMPAGVLATGMALLTGGLLPLRLRRRTTDAQHLRAASTPAPPSPPAHGDTDLDRLGDLFFSGTQHDEQQPCHLHIIDPERCRRECIAVYGAPCTRFCPAQVYTLAEDGEHIRIDAANCLHCKTCAIKDPLGNIEWRLPEGGGGPRYVGM